MNKIFKNLLHFLVISLCFLILSCDKNETQGKKYSQLNDSATILALGDSLTYGFGAAKNADYPSQLAILSSKNVINAGVSGDTSDQALSRLPQLLEEHNPQLVIVCIGGNDFLRKYPQDQTKANIAAIIKEIQNKNIPVILVAVPHLTLSAAFSILKDHPLYEELSNEYKVPLLRAAWSEILANESLKSDQIHANSEGYNLFAQKLYAFMKELGF